jgi:hypothetical protein
MSILKSPMPKRLARRQRLSSYKPAFSSPIDHRGTTINEGPPLHQLDCQCLRNRFSRKESNGGLVIARQVVGFSRHGVPAIIRTTLLRRTSITFEGSGSPRRMIIIGRSG